MNELNSEGPTQVPQPARREAKLLVPIIVLALAVAGIGAYFALRTPTPPPAPPVPVAAAPAPPAPPPDVAIPPPADSDTQLRQELQAVSPRPDWATWLQQPGLLERFSVVLDNFVEDVSPRKQLAFLAPAEPFAATSRAGKWFIDPRGYARYDRVGDVVGSIDAKACATAVRALHPLLESAYHALGYPDRPLDPVIGHALKRLANAPVAEGDVPLRKEGRLYRFADDKLEESGPVEKHLLRMGPRNTHLVQAKARELAAALGLSLN